MQQHRPSGEWRPTRRGRRHRDEGRAGGRLGSGRRCTDGAAAGQKAKPPFGVLTQACSLPLSLFMFWDTDLTDFHDGVCFGKASHGVKVFPLEITFSGTGIRVHLTRVVRLQMVLHIDRYFV